MEPNWEMRMLLVDNNQVTLKLIEKTIKVHSKNKCVVHASTNLAMLYKELHLFNPDVIVSTRTCRGFEAFDVLMMVKKYNEYLPVYIIATDVKRINDIFLLQQGANEILLLSDLDKLYTKTKASFDKNVFELISK